MSPLMQLAITFLVIFIIAVLLTSLLLHIVEKLKPNKFDVWEKEIIADYIKLAQLDTKNRKDRKVEAYKALKELQEK